MDVPGCREAGQAGLALDTLHGGAFTQGVTVER